MPASRLAQSQTFRKTCKREVSFKRKHLNTRPFCKNVVRYVYKCIFSRSNVASMFSLVYSLYISIIY